MSFNSKWNLGVLQVRCPLCGRKNGSMCRDANGKCVPMSHPERRKEALRVTVGAVMDRRSA